MARSIAFLGTAAFVLLAPASALPCSCLPMASPCTAVGGPAVIFIGTPFAVEEVGRRDGVPLLRFHFTIDEAIQSVDRQTADVETAADTAACGYPFVKGTKYLVYASGSAGAFRTSFCSRTGPVTARQDDIELLRQTAAGAIRPRLFGEVYRLQLQLDGFYSHYYVTGGAPDITVQATNGIQIYEGRTDRQGRFSITAPPARYEVKPQLPPSLVRLFDQPVTASVDRCSGEVSVPVATVPLLGTLRFADGEAGVQQVMLRVMALGPDGSVSFERSTLAFTEPGGAWKLPGLPAGQYLLGVSVFDTPTPHTPYPATWYPNANRTQDATVLNVTDEGTVSVDFQLPRRIAEITLRGKTVVADGTPRSRVSVTLYDTEARAGSGGVSFATSDEDGRFTIAALSGRRYRIEASEFRPGGWKSDLIDVTDNAVRSGLTITLIPPR